jgi:uncharacterized membrane protein
MVTTSVRRPPRVVGVLLGYITLTVLVVGWVVVRVVGLLGVGAVDGWQPALRGGLALMFVVAASGRIGPQRAGLVAMVPPRLPRPGLLVAATGVLEVAGAVGLVLPATYRLAAACLALLMVAVFPANVHAARTGVSLAGRPVPRLLPRTLQQILYVGVLVLLVVA